MFVFLKKCPICGREVEVYGGEENWTPTLNDPDSGGDPYYINCACGLSFDIGYCDYSDFESAWNHRVQEDYNSVGIEVGDKRFCIVNGYPEYEVMEGECYKIGRRNNNSTKYTFKMGCYKTYTFAESSFGKKVFETIKEAEAAVKKLNKARTK